MHHGSPESQVIHRTGAKEPGALKNAQLKLNEASEFGRF